MNLPELTARCRNGIALAEDAIQAAVADLLDPVVDPGVKMDFLRALTEKGETAEELAGFVRALLPHAVDPGFRGHWEGQRILDCCGTGGGGLNLFNVSTGILFILAACGVPVAKHGNRGITKKSGSADVLAALRVPVAQSAAEARGQMERLGFTFIAAPVFHPAFKHLAPIRQALAKEGRRTVFNLLGPLLNPCRPAAQMIGVFKKEHLPLFAGALLALGRECGAVVHGTGPAGEPLGEAGVFRENRVERTGPGAPFFTEQFQPGHALDELMVGSPEGSALLLEELLQGRGPEAGRELLVRNAAWGLATQRGPAGSAEGHLDEAREALVSGRAYAKLQAWRALAS